MNVIMPTGKSMHLSFVPLTGGGSMYSTSDENMQSAIETHHNFGVLYKLDKVVDETKVEVKPKEQPKVQEPEVKTVKVASLEDAKEFLVDRFGISRTKLRSKKQIMDAAEAHNVMFEGI